MQKTGDACETSQTPPSGACLACLTPPPPPSAARQSGLESGEQAEKLRKLVGPHMLRRIKKGIVNVPPKREIMVPVELSSLQVHGRFGRSTHVFGPATSVLVA